MKESIKSKVLMDAHGKKTATDTDFVVNIDVFILRTCNLKSSSRLTFIITKAYSPLQYMVVDTHY
jgi:hypothetical protein